MMLAWATSHRGLKGDACTAESAEYAEREGQGLCGRAARMCPAAFWIGDAGSTDRQRYA